nr:MAG TPA: hypothetical protein [Caudoviricetes sp.]
MKYLMNVVIKDPHTEPGMVSDMLLKFRCFFTKDDDNYTYGKKAYLSIIGESSDKYIDLRYDKNYHRGKEKEYLEYWANNYWTGKNGAWEIKSLNITEVE